MDPWGTPHMISLRSEHTPFTLVTWVLSSRYEVNHFTVELLHPNCFSILPIISHD